MLKILRSDYLGTTVFALSGRIEETDLPELHILLNAEAKTTDLTIDLLEVQLVAREGVRFLAACEARGIKLKNCSSYICQWLGTRKEWVEGHEHGA